MMSLPLWECGLKYVMEIGKKGALHVTPFVGVWIEICMSEDSNPRICVTPFVGVWIEITRALQELTR